MNTKAIIGVIVIIIIGAGAYVIWGRSGTGGYGPTNTVPVGGGSNSIQQLVAAGNPITCTFSTTTSSGKETGTIYIANGMVAGDFVVNDPQAGSIDAHMIVSNQTSYTWTSASAQGFKSTVSTTSSAQTTGVGYSAQMDYLCQSWNPDTSKFNLPSNISFTSTASFTPPAQGAGATGAASGGAQGTAAQCAECNGLPSAQKAQCLAALQC